MLGQDLKEMADSIAEDTIPETLFYRLLTSAKNRRESLRPWEILKAVDTTKTASVGDTYATSKALPALFRSPFKMMVGTDLEYLPIPFEEQHLYRNAGQRYFLDIANSVYYLTGNVTTSRTIYLYYLKRTADFTVANKATVGICVWPDDYQPLLAFDVAAMYQGGVDYDDVSARMAPVNKAEAKAIEEAMIAWDDELKRMSRGNNRLPTSNFEDLHPGRGGGIANLGTM